MVSHVVGRTGMDLLAIGVELVVGVAAVGGGVLMLLAPDGHLLGMTTAQLSSTPFRDYVIPGIGLLTVIGVGMLLAALATVSRDHRAPYAAAAVGCALMGLEVAEVVTIPFSVLQPTMFAAGLAIAAWGGANARRYPLDA